MTLHILLHTAGWHLPGWLQAPGWYRPLSKFVLHFIRDHQALGLGTVILAEELGIPLPVPGDVAIAWGGYLTTLGGMAEWEAIVAVVVGAMLGSLCLFLVSRRFGHPFVMRFGHYVGLSQERFDRVEAAFQRWGPWAIIFGRHIPGVRIYLSAMAGIFEMRTSVFVASVAVSSTAWALIFITIGRVVGRPVWRLSRLVPAHLVPYAVLLAALVAVIFIARSHGWHPFRRRASLRSGAGAAAQPPAELRET